MGRSIGHVRATMRPYRIINTFDEGRSTMYGHTYIGPGTSIGDQYELVIADRHCILPNAPIPARETVMAACLKRGLKKMTEHPRAEKEARDCAQPQDYLIALRDRSDAIGRIKKVDKLRGALLGVEIEYYPAIRPRANPLLQEGHDGSLNPGGSEIRRLTWQDPDGRLSGLLCLAPDLFGARVDHKCGLHVHVDMRHLSPESAATTYDRVTDTYPVLKKLVPKSRHENRYCLWLNNRNNTRADFAGRDVGKYCAVNWQAYDEHGTIEFRCQEGSVSAPGIESWALFCRWLVGWCAIRANTPPTTWPALIACCPEPIRSWAVIRAQTLHGFRILVNERTTAAL